MTPLFPQLVKESNLTIDQGHQPMEFMSVAFAVLMNGWIFAASGALVMVAVLGTYFKMREKELLDEITSLKAMFAKSEEDVKRAEKKIIGIKVEMNEKITSLKREHHKEKTNLIAASQATEKELKAELISLQDTREEYVHQVENLQAQVERDEQEYMEKVLHLKKDAEERLEAQKLGMEEAMNQARVEHARATVELQKKVSALETALLHG